MASFTAPSTPSHQPILHRSFTLPAKLIDTTKLQTQHRTPSPGAVETLFAHHAGRIVSFSPPLDLSAPRSRSTSLAGLAVDAEPIGTLPYVSHTERTIAAGMSKLTAVQFALLTYPRLASYRPCTWVGSFPKLWQACTSHSCKVAVLVCRRRNSVRPAHKKKQLLSYRVAERLYRGPASCG